MLAAPALSVGAGGQSQWPAAHCTPRVILRFASSRSSPHIEPNGREMQQGVIKFFREDKGYGFIERDQGGTYSFISVRSTKILTPWQKGSGCRLKRAPAVEPA